MIGLPSHFIYSHLLLTFQLFPTFSGELFPPSFVPVFNLYLLFDYTISQIPYCRLLEFTGISYPFSTSVKISMTVSVLSDAFSNPPNRKPRDLLLISGVLPHPSSNKLIISQRHLFCLVRFCSLYDMFGLFGFFPFGGPVSFLRTSLLFDFTSLLYDMFGLFGFFPFGGPVSFLRTSLLFDFTSLLLAIIKFYLSFPRV